MTACRITLDDKDLNMHFSFYHISYQDERSAEIKIESLDLPLLDQVELNKNNAEPMIDTLTHFSWKNDT